MTWVNEIVGYLQESMNVSGKMAAWVDRSHAQSRSASQGPCYGYLDDSSNLFFF